MKLNSFGKGKTQTRCSESIDTFIKKLETYEFIIELLNDQGAALETWKNMFEINSHQFIKNEQKVVLKGTAELNVQLAVL